MVTDEEWHAVVNNDSTYDSYFRYAVKTTRIFCRPSCHSRLPKRENIEIYYDLTEPERQGYRPCKRCRPTDQVVDNDTWSKEIETILQQNYQLNLTLKELAYLAHGSESNLRHVFKKVTNQTPHQRLFEIRMEQAKKELIHSNHSIERIAINVGFSNDSYFIRKFKAFYGQSPKQFRKNSIDLK